MEKVLQSFKAKSPEKAYLLCYMKECLGHRVRLSKALLKVKLFQNILKIL